MPINIRLRYDVWLKRAVSRSKYLDTALVAVLLVLNELIQLFQNKCTVRKITADKDETRDTTVI